jgi:4-nitrophenyl phosphatase
MRFGRFDTFIFDLDGTIWIYPKLIEGARAIVEKIKKKKRTFLLASNFSVLSRKETIKKLSKLGLDIEPNELITSSYVIAQWLKDKECKVIAFGKGVKKELKDNGIKVSKSLPVDYLVVGHDLEFNYKKLALSYKAVKEGAKLLVTSYGNLWPTAQGILPGTGPIIKPIELLIGKKALLFGKPSKFMAQFIDMNICCPRKKVVLFGDELDSDIKLGKNLGYFTVLVKSGVNKEFRKIKPDLTLNSIRDIKL